MVELLSYPYPCHGLGFLHSIAESKRLEFNESAGPYI